MCQHFKPALLWMMVLAACQSVPDAQHTAPEENKVQQAGIGVSLPAAPPVKKEITALHLSERSVIHVMSALRQSKDTASNGEAVPPCKDWNLSETSILTILKHGRAMNAHDLHYLYEVLPCEVDGVVEIDSSRYNYSINAGSFFLLYDEDTTYYFECRQPEDRKFFLAAGGDSGNIFVER
jgi:hypothetical protein